MPENHNFPLPHFLSWMDDARGSEPSDPDAACLATVDKNGFPNARVVLVRRIDDRGFCFFTNCESQKGEELFHTPKAALNFHWKTLKRQIRVRGTVEPVSPQEADEYFATRPAGHKIGAWASQQSRPLPNRQLLIDRAKAMEEKFGEDVPRPDYWSGYRLVPFSIEFWQEGEFRLHHRTRYDLNDGGYWTIATLFP